MKVRSFPALKSVTIFAGISIFGVAFGISLTTDDDTMDFDFPPQLRRAYTEFGCDGERRETDYFKDYARCGVYYQCDENRSTTMFNCKGDKSFDEKQQKCVDDPSCSSQEEYPDNQGDYRCDRDYDKHGIGPHNCSEYYVCHWTGEYYTLEFKTCRVESKENPGQFFGSFYSQFAKKCRPKNYLDGICPQSLILDPGGWCPAITYKQSPDTCTKYYKCIRNRFVLLTECPPGEIYDGSSDNPGCMPGSCPEPEKPLPSNWTCIADGKDNLHPEDCTKYYKCHACKSSHKTSAWCYEHFERCGFDEYFDVTLRKCVSSKMCPQELSVLPTGQGWQCERQGERSIHPDSCKHYYSCLKCEKSPNGWCYLTSNCSTGEYFNNEIKECDSSPSCPQDPLELPRGVGWHCEKENERNVAPDKCTQFYTCHACEKPRKWCYVRHNCPPGQTFDEIEDTCHDGRCPSYPPILPQNWTCTNEKELNVDPTNCQHYYICVRCPDDHPWCYQPKECSEGIFFNDFNKTCVASKVCPQEGSDLTSEPGSGCNYKGETNVHPKDCTQFNTCIRCTEPTGWCHETTKCAAGMFFDQEKKNCSKSRKCPQDWTELPVGPGWECTVEDETNVLPVNCSHFYTCHSCDKPRKWCYITHECPFGQTFTDIEDSCFSGRCVTYPPILPENWTCTEENQLNVDPTDCQQYYKCILCPDEYPWCYEPLECPDNKYFDDWNKTCVASKICPQQRPELPSGWNCEKDRETNVHPTDCTQFYTCLDCTKPSGWCHETTKCGPGMFFDQGKRECVKDDKCPQERVELPPGWNCTVEDEKNVVPDNCSSFYTCHSCDKPSKWCYIRHECPAGQTFDNVGKSCKEGRCPSYPPIVPDSINCTKENQLHVDPKNCQKFIKCIRCPDNHPWCYESQECPDGHYFDDYHKSCIITKICPQDRLELPTGPKWSCQEDQEINIYPENCQIYYTCLRCTKPSGWCYKTDNCTDKMYFDQAKKKCVKTKVCPQDLLELPSGPGWKCTDEDEKNGVPGNCSSFYTCHSCDKPRKWCYTRQECPSGETFDEIEDSCHEGRCPLYPPILPQNWICTVEKELNVDPTSCQQYYKCILCPDDYPWCYEPKECPDGIYFDNANKTCVASKICPQDLPELPSGPGWQCEKDKETNVLPTDCTQFYTCIRCSKPSGWCYDATKCSPGMFFDQEKKECVNTKKCPQEMLELPSGPGWTCAVEGEKNVVPDNCSSFYTCYACDKPRKWCYIREDCPAGQTFDNVKKGCVEGRCPAYPPILPQNMTCTNESLLNVDPGNCKKFLKCIPCPDNFTWCYESKECSNLEYFDDFNKACAVSTVCPQERPELPSGVGWSCQKDKEINVHPTDCTQFYTCFRCTKPSGWCYEATKCSPGMFFDQPKRECVKSTTCPQDMLELPSAPGWNCTVENEKNVLPDNCSSFYTCHSCDKPRKWCYIPHECPSGQTFDNVQKSCAAGRCPSYPPILPQNWACATENQLNVEPTNCKQFFKCLRCPDNYPWCYEPQNCSQGEFFDDLNKTCIASTTCPQERSELPSGWNCEKDKEVNVHPKDCAQFYTCLRCTKPSGWCYETTQCDNGMFFDQNKRQCIKSKICPQDLIELPSEPEWKCAAEEEKNLMPKNCSAFYTCHSCDKPRKWCYIPHECPTGQTFDDVGKGCVTARCPSYPPVLPENIKCTKENQLNVDPKNCHKFIQCIRCPDEHEWCYEPKECPDDKFFDDLNKTCIVNKICPQERPELPSGTGWNCQKEMETNVHPKDCAQFYTCFRCTKPSGWCYETTKCDHGMFFDQNKRQCVKTKICPQDLIELPSEPDWKCAADEEKNVLPKNCSAFYTCHSCDKPRKWCYIPHECPSGQTFDNIEKSCFQTRCPSYPPVLPKDWTCTTKINVDPTNCKNFYKCIGCPDDYEWCYESHECSNGEFFDDLNKTCVVSKRCPQERPELPSGPGWNCEKDKEINVHPKDCAQFYTCLRCTKPSGWCYEATKCGSGMFFDQNKKQCIKTKICPQDLIELPSEPEWKCAAEEEKNLMPKNCSAFYTCHACDKPRKWCYIPHKCPTGETFDDVDKSCVPARCPSYLPVLPDKWTCTKENELNVDPTNCRHFYTCVKCPDDHEWCYKSQECPENNFFDDLNKTCVASKICPQERKELPSGAGWNCQKEKETNVHPKDCTNFYTCFRCTKPSGWCYEASKCSPGMFYDQSKRECVKSQTCPQDMLELPTAPGWNCTAEQEKHVMPKNCSAFYTCHACDKPRKWCYIPHKCPTGETFNDVDKGCVPERCPSYPPVVPENIKCTKENQLNVDPTNCQKFVKCIRCPDEPEWCYEPQECPDNNFFDDLNKTCVASKKCPQERPELPSGTGWNCQKEKETNVHPKDCTQFYTCFRCTKPRGWCYEATKCGSGMFFDQQKRQCAKSKLCPQDLKELPREPDWICESEEEKHVVPKNCSYFYTCHSCDKPRKWCYIPHQCPAGQTFDNDEQICVDGRCPSFPKLLSRDVLCTTENEITADPDNCQKYLKCMRCPDEPKRWCSRQSFDCPHDTFFDEFNKTCVVSKMCPQDLPELPLGPGWNCEKDKDINVHPKDCTQLYTCIPCKKPRGWCYATTKCIRGMLFNQEDKHCVKTKMCPQKWLELPSTPGWNCTAENERYGVPGNCSSFYTCYQCDKPRKWCYIQKECPAGQTFDDMDKICVDRRCSSYPPLLPKGINCTKEGELHVNPMDCQQFFKCIRCPDDQNKWCYENQECPDDKFFDDLNKTCVASKMCPQERPELPSGWNCQKDGETHVHPTDCSQFYTCRRCSKPGGWCYETSKCSHGMLFYQEKRLCTKTKKCPQNWVELPSSPEWKCRAENEKNVMPEECSYYYTCYACDKPRKWCYVRHECPPGKTFDDFGKKCVAERCPSYPPILPQNWKCAKENELNVDPTDCEQFYKCIRCPDHYPWCYEMQDCPEGIFFNDFNKTCVASGVCPQDHPELPLREGWNCSREGETNVHPEDCTQFYSCVRCNKPRGWCYDATNCGSGKYFDQEKKKCVASRICPQLLRELPSEPEWHCKLEEEKKIVPTNCTSSYTCYSCDKPRKWCYTAEDCPPGETFDQERGQCIKGRCKYWPASLDNSGACLALNEIRSDPNDCTKSCKCVKCPDKQHPWCCEPVASCPPKEWFDDTLKRCVKGDYCPQSLIEIGKGPGWGCGKQGEKNVLPTACSKFYTCLSCDKPRKWCYLKEESCPVGFYFDQSQRQCVVGVCPQNRGEIPNGFTCGKDGEEHVLPGDCSKYYRCHKCQANPKKWCYEELKCAATQTYDDTNKTCVVGRCPQLDPVIPNNWKCNNHGEVNVVPRECSKFFTCLACKDGPWCYKKVETCPRGQSFNNTSKKCVVGRCPQYPPPLPSRYTAW